MSHPAGIARTPEPPYYAVIFTSVRTPGDNGYGETAQKMIDLAMTMPGYLGVESTHGDSLGITIETEQPAVLDKLLQNRPCMSASPKSGIHVDATRPYVQCRQHLR